MECSTRHTLAPIDSIFGGQLPPSLPPGVRLVEAHSLQSERRPTSSSLPRNVYSGPEWVLFSWYSWGSWGLNINWALRHPLPHFQTHKAVVVFILREARWGWLINYYFPRLLILNLLIIGMSDSLSYNELKQGLRGSKFQWNDNFLPQSQPLFTSIVVIQLFP